MVLGSFNPELLSVNSMAGNGILRPEESELTKQIEHNKDISVSKIANISVYCDCKRLQIGTVDIVMKNRLCELCSDILKWQNIKKLEGIGVNPHIVIGFENEFDYMAFVSNLMPSERWNDFYDSSFASSIQIIKHRLNDSNYHESVVVQIVKNNERFPVYGVNMNIYYPVSTLVDILNTCYEASSIYEERISKFESLLERL